MQTALCRLFAALGATATLLTIGPATAASAQSASILSPINGGSVSSPAASHLISYDGDWSMDIAASGDVYARLASGHGISLRVERVSAACASGRQGGTAVRVRAYLDGASVALLVYSHLADVAVAVNQTIGNGTRLGRVATGLPVDGRCWTGPHVHFEARNDRSYACYAPLGAGAGVNAGTEIGRIGAVGAGGQRTPCAGPPAGSNPLGAYDEAISPTPGAVRVRGWSFDPDNRGAALPMHVYLGGQAGQAGVEGRAFTADAFRPDVAAVHAGVGDRHGLDQTFETGKRGNQPVCVYAINIGGGSNVLLGCKTVTIADPNPLGAFDEVISPEPGKLRVRGWTFDPNARAAVGEMHVYVGGEAGQAGVEGHAFRAGASRPDVDRVHGAGANHGLDATFATGKRGAQRVCVYAINTGPGSNIGLGCKTATIATPVPATAAPLVPTTPGQLDATTPGPPPETAAGASGPPTTARPQQPGARLPRRVARRAVLRITISGLAADTRVTVTWQRGRAVVRDRARLTGGRISARAPRRAGMYTLTLSHTGGRIARARVQVR